MLSDADILNATWRTEFHHVSAKNSDGTPVRCRVNGKLQSYKRDFKAFRLPVKYGLKDCFYITEYNRKDWVRAGHTD